MDCRKCSRALPEDAVYCCYCGVKQLLAKKKATKRSNGTGSVRKRGKTWTAIGPAKTIFKDGKFITYGITFDVGKATIKPESMGEINRIVTLMNENPDSEVATRFLASMSLTVPVISPLI